MKSRSMTRGAVSIAFMSAVSCIALSLGASSGSAVTVHLSADETDQPSDLDTVNLSKQLNLSIGEVERQLALQATMDSIPFEDLDSGYAEDGSVMGDSFSLWYRSARAPSEPLKRAMQAAGVLDFVTFEQVPLSLSDLMERASALYRDLRSADLPVGVTIDTGTGGVVLHPLPLEADFRGDRLFTRDLAEEYAEASQLPFTWGSPPPSPASWGGRDMIGAGGACTGGFVMANDGNRRMSTAAHCLADGNNTITYAGVDGYLETRTLDRTPFYDYGTFDRADVDWVRKVRYSDSGETRRPNAEQAWSSMDVGDPVSKYGRTTGYTLGTIVDKHDYSPYGCDPESWMTRVDANGAYPKMCAGGDSGGPWMYNLTAYGITSGYYESGDWDCVFFPISRATWGHVALS